jgi:hypothetical protein
VNNQPPRALVRTLALAGFSGVWVDRHGYSPDDPETADIPTRRDPEDAIVRAAGSEAETSPDGRYVFVSIEHVRQRLVSELGPGGYARAHEQALHPLLVPRYREGVGEEEGGAGQTWRWMASRARIVVKNRLNRERTIVVSARLRLPGPRSQRVEVQSGSFQDALMATDEGTLFQRTVVLPSLRRLEIRFSCPDRPAPPTGRVEVPCFQLVDFRAVDLNSPPEIVMPGGETGDGEG